MILAVIAINGFLPLYQYFFFPSPIVKIRSFWTDLFLVIALIIHIGPLLIVPILIGILWYIRTKKREKYSGGLILDSQNRKHPIKGFKISSFYALFAVPALLLHYFPRSYWELFWWGMTFVCLYVRFGTEWAPLIRYSKAVSRLQTKQEMATKEDVRTAIPSLFALGITFFLIPMVISLRIYPVPFLLGYFIKYIIQRKYFDDFSDKIFYYRWKMKVEKGLVMRIYKLMMFFMIFFSAIVYIFTFF